jgi:hypothetical protein
MGGAMTPLGPDDDATVSYTVKELLTDLKGSVDKLHGKLDTKADRLQVDALDLQVKENTKDIIELRQRQHDHDNWRAATEVEQARQREAAEKASERKIEWWKWLLGAVASALLILIGALQLYKMIHP